MRVPNIAVAVVVAVSGLGLTSALASPATAAPSSVSVAARSTEATTTTKAVKPRVPAKPVKPAPVKPVKPAPVKPVKPAPVKPAPVKVVTFTATGSVTAVDVTAGTVSVQSKGGTKDVKGTTVTVTVPTAAKVIVNDAPATLAAVTVGDKVAVTGTRVGTVLTATKVIASTVTTPAPQVP